MPKNRLKLRQRGHAGITEIGAGQCLPLAQSNCRSPEGGLESSLRFYGYFLIKSLTFLLGTPWCKAPSDLVTGEGMNYSASPLFLGLYHSLYLSVYAVGEERRNFENSDLHSTLKGSPRVSSSPREWVKIRIGNFSVVRWCATLKNSAHFFLPPASA